MSKIVAAVNVMISNPSKITNVIRGQHENECFFKYDNRHKWSIYRNRNDGYCLNYYSSDSNLEELASIPDEAWDHDSPAQVVYTTSELGTKEALATFSELFTIVSEKALGMDKILDDIINSDFPF